MVIKNGYNDAPTSIKIIGRTNSSIELWIEQTGISDKETLGYMTLDELLALKQEIECAIKEVFKL